MSNADPNRQEPPRDPVTGENISWRTAALTMVVFDRPAPTGEEIVSLLHEVFDGTTPVEQSAESERGAIVRIEDASVYVQPVNAPVPDDQATDAARGIPMWNTDSSEIDAHASHLMVLSRREPTEDGEPEYMDPRADTLRCELAAAHVTAALTALPDAVAVYVPTAHSTLPATAYREIVSGNAMPIPALIGVRAGWQDEESASVYTTGMGRFGRHEMQRIAVPGTPADAYGQMCDLVAYQLGTGTTFEPGVTLQLSEDLSLTTALVDSQFGPWQSLELTPASPPGEGYEI